MQLCDLQHKPFIYLFIFSQKNKWEMIHVHSENRACGDFGCCHEFIELTLVQTGVNQKKRAYTTILSFTGDWIQLRDLAGMNIYSLTKENCAWRNLAWSQTFMLVSLLQLSVTCQWFKRLNHCQADGGRASMDSFTCVNSGYPFSNLSCLKSIVYSNNLLGRQSLFSRKCWVWIHPTPSGFPPKFSIMWSLSFTSSIHFAQKKNLCLARPYFMHFHRVLTCTVLATVVTLS